MTQDPLINALQAIVGRGHVLTSSQAMQRYCAGYRFGSGKALAVVRPGSLVEQWRALQACVTADKIVIFQAANTGLTGGSTPAGADYDRDIVIINTLRLNRIRLIREGRQVICQPGATLDQLERLLKPLGRDPHSVIGSSCIGASVAGGIANNSGGALVRRGPAYTQLALFARRMENGSLELVNHLGLRLKGLPEEILGRIDRDDFSESDVDDGAGAASDANYSQHVRDVEADTPARFNADPQRLFEASGCAGRLALFALRLDTFPAEATRKLFYVGTNDVTALEDLRRHILADFKTLPISGEYLHREAFDIARVYGKDTFLIIEKLGTRYLAPLFALKSRFDAFCGRWKIFPRHMGDRLLQMFSRLFPEHLPAPILDFRQKFEHHLLLEVAGPGLDETRDFLSQFFADPAHGGWFECDEAQARKAMLHRFAVAGAAVRYRKIHADEVEDILALDIALRRNDRDWFETLPAGITQHLAHKLYYGHFLCHVFHQDYLVKKGADTETLKEQMLAILDGRGAEYPAEHNVGHLYKAKPALKEFYRRLDPCNAFNPGIGMTSKKRGWSE